MKEKNEIKKRNINKNNNQLVIEKKIQIDNHNKYIVKLTYR